jgi:hypothetical protein
LDNLIEPQSMRTRNTSACGADIDRLGEFQEIATSGVNAA